MMRLLGPLCAVLCAKITGTPSAAAPDPEERPLLTRFIRSAAIALGLLSLAACDLPTLPTSGAVDPAKPVTVALLVPLGSGDAQREALAQSLVNAAKLASGDLQGVELDLKVYPTAGDQAQAATAAQTAIDDGAEVILGPLFGTAATAVAPIAAGRGVQVLSFSNNVQIAGGNLYILGSTFENTARRIVGYARGQGIADLGIVHPEGIEGEQGRDAVTLAAQAAGRADRGDRILPAVGAGDHSERSRYRAEPARVGRQCGGADRWTHQRADLRGRDAEGPGRAGRAGALHGLAALGYQPAGDCPTGPAGRLVRRA